MCTGLALSLLLRTGVSWAFGQLPTILLLRGLPLRLLWLRNHLVYHLLRRDCYTCAYAYDMRECMHDLQKLQVHNNQTNFKLIASNTPYETLSATATPVRPVTLNPVTPPVRPVPPTGQTGPNQNKN